MNFIDSAVAAMWPLIQAGVIASFFLMALAQPGFMLFAAGAGSRKNAIAAIYRGFVGATLAALFYLLFGAEIAAGEGFFIDQLRALGLAGASIEAAETAPRPGQAFAPMLEVATALLAYGVAATATSGRATPLATALFAAVFAGVIYPLAVFLIGDPSGPVSLAARALGAEPPAASFPLDLAALHLIGAGAALAGALMLGPRLGFNGYDPINLGHDRLFRVAASHAPHHAPMAAQGALLITLGLIGAALAVSFATLSAEVEQIATTGPRAAAAEIEGRIAAALSALLVSLGGGVVAIIALQWLFQRDLEIMDLLYGAIAGIAALMGAGGVASVEAAAVIGVLGAIGARLARTLIHSIHLDDPLATISTHGVAAIIGVGLSPLTIAPLSHDPLEWLALAPVIGQNLGLGFALFLAAFVAGVIGYKIVEILCKITAVILRRASLREALRGNQLRIDYEAEIFGLDETRHGQDAYSFRPMR